jgi:hypothetical protein
MSDTPRATQDDDSGLTDNAADDSSVGGRSAGDSSAGDSGTPDVSAEPDMSTEPDDAPDAPAAIAVGSPAKVMRIGTMVKQLLEEVRNAPLDEAARVRLAEVHDRSLRELEDGLSPDLVAELRRISLPFSDDVSPSDAELRVAQAQLVGWLEGLFHGLQTALVAQQMTTQAQLSQMRRALPPGSAGPRPEDGPRGVPGAGRHERRPDERHPGQYL